MDHGDPKRCKCMQKLGIRIGKILTIISWIGLPFLGLSPIMVMLDSVFGVDVGLNNPLVFRALLGMFSLGILGMVWLVFIEPSIVTSPQNRDNSN